MLLKLKKVNSKAKLPVVEQGSVGYDLFAVGEHFIAPGQSALIPTGIALAIPQGHYGRVASKSGLSVKHNIEVGAGVIDPSYRGELKVHLYNFSDRVFEISEGQKVAQLILEKCSLAMIEEVDDLDQTSRGEKGFGSTGDF